MEDLSLHILDIVENSIDAGASKIEIVITENVSKNWLFLKVKDNGKGINKKTLAKVMDPFYTTKKVRRVGMGLSLLAQAAREAGGDIEIKSVKGKGTVVSARFIYNHIDRRPLGSMADTLIALIGPVRDRRIDFMYKHQKNGLGFMFDTKDIRKRLSTVDISDPEVLAFLRKEIINGLEKIKAGP